MALHDCHGTGTLQGLECQYEPIGILGRGSFGTVLLTRVAVPPSSSHADGEFRVIKQVELPDDEARRAEVLGEIDMLQSLSHPNIIGYHETFVENRCVCIAMEYASGGDLAEAIEARRAGTQRFQEREAMAIFVQTSLAVQYMHGRRVLHRDLKSQNIFLTSQGIVKLGDFGIAKALQASRRCAETQIGSPYYMPPEICENRPYGFKADVWCLGVVLYELLALEVPFSACSIAALALKIVTVEPKPVPAIYGSETRAMLRTLLAKRPDDRPTIDEIAALPHVRRSICALVTSTSRNALDAYSHCANSGDSLISMSNLTSS